MIFSSTNYKRILGFLSFALIASTGLYVAITQFLDPYVIGDGWPSQFPLANWLTLVGVLVLVLQSFSLNLNETSFKILNQQSS